MSVAGMFDMKSEQLCALHRFRLIAHCPEGLLESGQLVVPTPLVEPVEERVEMSHLDARGNPEFSLDVVSDCLLRCRKLGDA